MNTMNIKTRCAPPTATGQERKMSRLRAHFAKCAYSPQLLRRQSCQGAPEGIWRIHRPVDALLPHTNPRLEFQQMTEQRPSRDARGGLELAQRPRLLLQRAEDLDPPRMGERGGPFEECLTGLDSR